jgi:cytochrome c-type biogenesis protein CcmE
VKPRHKRLILIVIAIAGLVVASVLVMNALRSNTSYFFSPTRIVANEAPRDRTIRIGGVVKKDSIKRLQGLDMEFIVTDNVADVKVFYSGILPDLFAEEKSVVTKGRLQADGSFKAEQVLAKHDEKYIPPEVAEAMERAKELKAKQK